MPQAYKSRFDRAQLTATSGVSVIAVDWFFGSAASIDGNASGAQGSITLVANTGTAFSGVNSTATGAQAAISLTANTATATGTSVAVDGNAAGNQGQIGLVANNATASGTSGEIPATHGGLVKSAKPKKREDYRAQIQAIIDKVQDDVLVELPEVEVQEIKRETVRNFAQEAYLDAIAVQMELNQLEMRLYLLAEDIEEDEFLLLS